MGKISFDHQQTNKISKPDKNMKKKKSPMKITYISSPVTVKVATASEFRAIVQELTGKDSYMGDDVGPQEMSVGELLRPIAVRRSDYGSEMQSRSVDVNEEDGFGGFEDMEVCFWKNLSDGFTGIVSHPPLYV